jgi:hypothetical protein
MKSIDASYKGKTCKELEFGAKRPTLYLSSLLFHIGDDTHNAY